LFAQLQQRFPKLDAFRGSIALAVNLEYSDGKTVLRDNDEVALIPPVSGGAITNKPSPAETALPLISEHAQIVSEAIQTAPILAASSGRKTAQWPSSMALCATTRAAAAPCISTTPPMRRWLCARWSSLPRQALGRFAIRDVRIVHRLGRLQIGESSVYIAVAAAHRAAAFDACRWLIDTLKTMVPIWKKEYFQDGAVWADGEPFPPEIPRADYNASK
jgi:hypothetical protein